MPTPRFHLPKRRCQAWRCGALVVTTLLISGAGIALAAEDCVADAPPVRVPAADWDRLYDAVDPALQRALEAAIRSSPRHRDLADRKLLAVGLVDLTDACAPRFARVNGNRTMYAASLPKIAILLAAYQAFEDGTLVETPEIQADLTAMIRTSSNSAATAMIDRLGFDQIARVLTDPRYRLYDRDRGGGLWVGKRFASTGKRVGDPLHNISHAANVTQICRFYYLLATGRIISPERSREILGHLSDPGLHHKFVGVLEERAPRARLFRKSGTWRTWHSDSTLVWGPDWRRYVLTALVESAEGEAVLRELVPLVETILAPAAVAARDRDSE